MRHQLWGGLALACVLGLTSGCQDVGTASGRDEQMLRTPGPSPSPHTPLDPLIPTTPGTRWEMVVTNPDGRQMEEEQILRAPRTMNGIRVFPIEMRQQGRLYRTEYYRIDETGVGLLAATDRDSILMSKPIPIVRFPVVFEAVTAWQGTMRFRKVDTSGSAYSRVVTRERVTVPAGEFDAYRVDTILSATINGEHLALPATRWFAPAVGLVKHRFSVGRSLYVKELKSHTPR